MAVEQKPRKQAVVIVHGMGEQRPLETLRSFVDAVWARHWNLMKPVKAETGQRQGDNRFWIVPDSRAGSLELRRITTPPNREKIQTDFFEFYWADIMSDTGLRHLRPWIFKLLFRRPKHVPPHVASLWCLLWSLILVFFAGASDAVYLLMSWREWDRAASWVQLIEPTILGAAILMGVCCFLVSLAKRLRAGKGAANLVVVTALLLALAASVGAAVRYWFDVGWPYILVATAGLLFVVLVVVTYAIGVKYFGDVARYTNDATNNVEKRQAVRTRGLELLRSLHKEHSYYRIVLVGHSLGSLIAYDLLMLWWAEHGPSTQRTLNFESRQELQAADHIAIGFQKAGGRDSSWMKDMRMPVGMKPGDSEAKQLAQLRRSQRRVSGRLSEEAVQPWLITDFITLGSPLTHAEFLVSSGGEGFDQLVRDRMISLCPPSVDGPEMSGHGAKTFFYEAVLQDGTTRSIPHHASVFAAVRWTNLYDPRSYVFFGDFVSGPLSGLFGRGVKDVEVRINQKGWGPLCRLFTHTSYWRVFKPDCSEGHIESLREALDLLDEGRKDLAGRSPG